MVEEEITTEVSLENEKYQVRVSSAGELCNPQELLNILGRQFKVAQKGLRMQEINRKYFNPNKRVDYPKHGLEIWPGFFSAVQLIDQKILINVDVSFKIIRKQNALQAFKDLLQSLFL